MNADAAIGIFMVATVAWGFLARDVYSQARHAQPYGWENVMFGQFTDVTPAFALAAVAVCALVIVVVVGLGKEILSYCFDPVTAEVSGVRAGFVHYLLMVLIALTVVIGVRVVGSVLATALLVLPGVTGTTLSLRMNRVFAVSVGVGLLGTVGGVLLHARWHFLPTGPVIVLLMLAMFLVAYVAKRARA
jgi:ABC-type Mn2+/Zn2+ transport system permease subunit